MVIITTRGLGGRHRGLRVLRGVESRVIRPYMVIITTRGLGGRHRGEILNAMSVEGTVREGGREGKSERKSARATRLTWWSMNMEAMRYFRAISPLF